MPLWLGGQTVGTGNTNPYRLTITQSNSFAAGDVVRLSGSTYIKAQADSLANSHAIGVVESATSTNFILVRHGTITLSGLTAGLPYYLSATTAGATTTTEPTTAGLISKVIFISLSTTSAFVYVQDGDSVLSPALGTAGESLKLEETVGGGFAAGDVVYNTGAAWAKAKADAASTSDVIGVIESVSGGLAVIVICGEITIGSASWTPGAVYFLSDATAGLLTTTEPTAAGSISRPLMVAITATRGVIYHLRGMVIPSTPSNFNGFNYVVNGAFDHWTAATSFATPASDTETADSWFIQYDGTIGTFTVSRQAFTAGQTDVSPQDSEFHFRWAHTVGASGSTYHRVRQAIGTARLRTLDILTISFYAKLSAGSQTVATRILQYFGTGGSPSASVATNCGSHTVGTTWTRFSATVTVPSISGKTLGSNLDDALYAELVLPINTTFTLDIANVQVEYGQTLSAFTRRLHTPAGDLLLA